MNKLSHEYPQILSVPPNSKGDDFIIGDVHGSLMALRHAISHMHDHDRLFISGDLIDRGADSLGVVNFIQEHNKTKKNIFCARGNHEDLFLNFMKEVYEFLKELPLQEDLISNPLLDHYKLNGGDWVIKLLDDKVNYNENYKKLLDCVKFIETLPYIIRVAKCQNKPYTIVHANLPFSEEWLDLKISQNNLYLSKEEIIQAIWSRKKDSYVKIKNFQRSTSSITYCGHSVGKRMRYVSNHINLDVGAYKFKQLLVANHTKKVLKVYDAQGIVANEKYNKAVKKVCLSLLPYQAFHLTSKETWQHMLMLTEKILDKSKRKARLNHMLNNLRDEIPDDKWQALTGSFVAY